MLPYLRQIYDISEIIHQLREFPNIEVMNSMNCLFNRNATLDNLQQLTLDQALADVAVFIHTAREHIASDGGKVRIS